MGGVIHESTDLSLEIERQIHLMRAWRKRFGPELYDMATASLGLKVRMRLRVREAGVVGAFPPLEPNDSQENLVHCSEAGEVFRAEAPRHTPVQQYLHHFILSSISGTKL